jgi:hypothetical protein
MMDIYFGFVFVFFMNFPCYPYFLPLSAKKGPCKTNIKTTTTSRLLLNE